MKNLARSFVLTLMLVGGVSVIGALIVYSNISSVQTTWDKFELGHSEKIRALNALRREFGYGGMIHLFKNYVLRQDQEQIANIIAKLGGINTVISHYSAFDLSREEATALDDIRKVVGAYFKNLIVAETLSKQGKNPIEIDQLVKVDDVPGINALTILEQIAERDFKTREPILSKPYLLAKLRKSLGYNGMIHHFKNFILRHDQERVTVTKKHLDAAKGILTLYAEQSLNAAESKAVMDILSVIDAYSKALTEAIRLVAKDKLPRAIDESVIVNDGPAFHGFNILTREFTSQSEREARNVEDSLAIVTSASMVTAWTTSIIIFTLIAATVWLFRYQIVRPISMMTNTMTALAAGNLEVPIHGARRNNEIGAMARAVEVFKTNAKALRDAHDVLEQRVLERTKALQDNEARFRDFATSASDWFWEIDIDRRYTFVSNTIRQEIGHPTSWYIGKAIDEIVERFFIQSEWKPFFEAFEARRPFRDLVFQRIERENHQWIQISGVPAFSEGGAFVGFRGSATNVTEQIEAEAAIRQSEADFREAVEAIDAGFVIFDQDDRMMFCNGRHRELFPTLAAAGLIKPGVFFEEIVRNGAESGRIPEANNRVEDYIHERMDLHREPKTTIEYRQSYGRWIGTEERRTLSGKYVAIHTDITAHKNAEDDLRVALAGAERANKAKTEFLANMSHELRTPLNAIIGFSEILSGELMGPIGSERYIEYARDIKSSGEHLLHLINDLLDLSKIEAGKEKLKKEQINLFDVVEGCVPIIAERAKKKGISCIFKVPEDLSPISVDLRSLKQILLNLLSNAVKFTMNGGKVVLTTTTSNKSLYIAINDNGPGIAEEKIPTLTDPFVRGEIDPHISQEGTGLGLAIVKSLVDLHDGELTIESEVGVGTTVTVTLPFDKS